jgi:hypothetical protein
MKTLDEIIEAMHVITNEANNSGFSFCAAIAPTLPDPITTIFCGESLKIIGLTDVIKINVFEQNQTIKIMGR